MSTSTLQFAQNTPECPVLDPVLENFPLAGRRSCAPPTPFSQRSQLGPMTSALSKTRIHHSSGLLLHHDSLIIIKELIKLLAIMDLHSVVVVIFCLQRSKSY